MPNVVQDHSHIMVTEKSYLDLFERDRLVYLSPDSRTDLVEYDADDVYIVGALHDGGVHSPSTLMQVNTIRQYYLLLLYVRAV